MKSLESTKLIQRFGLCSQAWGVLIATCFVAPSPMVMAYQGAPAQVTSVPPALAPHPPYTQATPDQLQQLVAPIALYPDSLVAQVLAASTFPEQIVEAERWTAAHPDLKDEALGQAVDQQPWDASVKALTAFPTVLGNMDKNLSWTSSLGDAYYNQQQAVMDAVQAMRQRAQAAGNLQTTPQQTVLVEDASIAIQPANPEIVYVPSYDPWLMYGFPVAAWPGWYPYPGIWADGPYLTFGIGFGIGFYGGFGWGWGHWGVDWQHRYSTYNNGRYYSRSNTFFNRGSYYQGGGQRGAQSNLARTGSGPRTAAGYRSGRPASTTVAGGSHPFAGSRAAARGYADPRGESGVRTDAFSGYDRGGETRTFSSRGSSSFGGGGAGVTHGGGGGGRGVGGGGGGGRR
jgi:hypothetical protein